MSRVSTKQIWVAAVAALVTGLLAAGCGGSSSSTASGSGRLSVSLADAPIAGASAVNLTISGVDANVNGQWVPVMSAARTINLLDLVKEPTALGTITLPAGTYTQVRLLPTECTITDLSGNTFPVNIPSGAQTGVKINVNYTVSPDEVTGILLDFNVSKSIHQQGNGQYQMQPVIPAVVKTLSGTVSGTVVDSAGKPIEGATVSAVNAANVEANSATTMADGTFKVWALMPDTYTINITKDTQSASKTGVVVTANQNTDLGSVTLP